VSLLPGPGEAVVVKVFDVGHPTRAKLSQRDKMLERSFNVVAPQHTKKETSAAAHVAEYAVVVDHRALLWIFHLPAETTLIGFAGAPWTVATYMAAGRGTPDQAPARRWIVEDPASFDAMITRLTEATIHYLSAQVTAGAEVVMLFDSWAGSLTPPQFERYVTAPAAEIAATLMERHPGLPIIGFPKGAGAMLPGYAAAAGVTGIAVDQHVPLDWARVAVGGRPLMGNLDPLLMTVGGTALEAEARRILDVMRGYPHIFNLGHGITPDADPAHVDTLLRVIRENA
ncbi:MAG: uroporphyrinogen decarboxylase family protein, partial [Pseudomonadota bacterium]